MAKSGYLQNLRIEETKRLLESGQMPVDEIDVEAGYEDTSFFRTGAFSSLRSLNNAQTSPL